MWEDTDIDVVAPEDRCCLCGSIGLSVGTLSTLISDMGSAMGTSLSSDFYYKKKASDFSGWGLPLLTYTQKQLKNLKQSRFL